MIRTDIKTTYLRAQGRNAPEPVVVVVAVAVAAAATAGSAAVQATATGDGQWVMGDGRCCRRRETDGEPRVMGWSVWWQVVLVFGLALVEDGQRVVGGASCDAAKPRVTQLSEAKSHTPTFT